MSDRAVTPHSRRLVNLIGEVYRPLPKGLFRKRQTVVGRALKLRRKAARWLGRGAETEE